MNELETVTKYFWTKIWKDNKCDDNITFYFLRNYRERKKEEEKERKREKERKKERKKEEGKRNLKRKKKRGKKRKKCNVALLTNMLTLSDVKPPNPLSNCCIHRHRSRFSLYFSATFFSLFSSLPELPSVLIRTNLPHSFSLLFSSFFFSVSSLIDPSIVNFHFWAFVLVIFLMGSLIFVEIIWIGGSQRSIMWF